MDIRLWKRLHQTRFAACIKDLEALGPLPSWPFAYATCSATSRGVWTSEWIEYASTSYIEEDIREQFVFQHPGPGMMITVLVYEMRVTEEMTCCLSIMDDTIKYPVEIYYCEAELDSDMNIASPWTQYNHIDTIRMPHPTTLTRLWTQRRRD